ncbi:hypothetical protein JHK86_024756 [Glycine max]|nr:hypothetical protein JHK86_024756 [Glycine max]
MKREKEGRLHRCYHKVKSSTMWLITIQQFEKDIDSFVGVQGTVAEATIERENPSVNAIIVPLGSVVTTDLRSDRVMTLKRNRSWFKKSAVISKIF